MLRKRYLRNVPLPTDLTNEQIFNALKETQLFFTTIRERTGINLSEIIQANNFSGVVSNVFTKMLNDCSAYHSFSDQRYPDLMHEFLGIGLEVKASNKPMKGGEGHNGHSGWHIVVCFEVLENGAIDFSQVEIADLIGYEYGQASDWKYQGSKRNENDSQRTETYITTDVGTAKLRDGTVYLNTDYVTITTSRIRNRWKLADSLPVPEYSIFREN